MNRESEGKSSGIPHLAKNERDTRISCTRHQATATCAAFIEESRMKFINAKKLPRKSGGVGYHCSQPSTLPLNQQRTLRFVVSHISRKTSEIWGTRGLPAGKTEKRSSGFAASFSAQVRFGEPGAPVHLLRPWFE